MRLSALLAASAALAFACAGPVAAQERWTGWQLDGFVGSATETASSDDPYLLDIEPNGTTYGIGGSYRFPLAGDLIAGIEASATFGTVEDTDTEVTCTVDDCGFNETGTFTTGSSYSGRFGATLGHEFGPVLVSGLAGIEIRERTMHTEYDADNGFDDYAYDQSWSAVGPYYGVRAEYAITDRVVLGAQWSRSEVVQSTIQFDDGDTYEDSAEFEEFQVRVGWRF